LESEQKLTGRFRTLDHEVATFLSMGLTQNYHLTEATTRALLPVFAHSVSCHDARKFTIKSVEIFR